MSPESWPTKRALFCRCCGEKMREISVAILVIYDAQTGKPGPDTARRWDCPRGTSALTMGHEGGHSSPDYEVLP